MVISVLKKVGHKTDFNTSIGWYINIISVKEMTVTVNLNYVKTLLKKNYGKILAITAAVFYRKFYRFFYSVEHKKNTLIDPKIRSLF